MADHLPPIARVRLARSLGRLLRPTFVLLAAAAAAVAFGLVAPMPLVPLARFALVAAGGAVALIGFWLAVRMLSIRLEVEEAALRVRWLGGERSYALTPGPVTRVRLVGEHASSLRPRSGILGWGFGRARLRGEETIEVVRLAPTPTAILVPTERGRLAIAPRDEAELLDALARAARARQRLEDLVTIGEHPEDAGSAVPRDSDGAADREVDRDVVVDRPREAVGADEAPPEPEPAPRLLTGIERAMLEAERASEQAEADARAGAEAERVARGQDAALVDATPATAGAAAAPDAPAEAATIERSARRRRWGRDRRAVTVAATSDAVAEAPIVEATGAEVRVRPPRARRRFTIARPSAALLLLPLAAAGSVWGIALLVDRLPDGGTDLARIASLGLVLSGPATSIGAIMARAWWPRLVGVVVAGGLVATAFIGRALLGPLN